MSLSFPAPAAPSTLTSGKRQRIAVVGSGISALSCAWLLKQGHDVTLFERADRLGGHSNTVTARTPEGDMPVDTGFMVYNARTYPNLTALFDHLALPTQPTDMSFSVSLDNGGFEYAAPGLFAQRRNLVRPRFWSMIRQVLRFYRQAGDAAASLEDPTVTLGDWLARNGFDRRLRDDHLLPMAAAIWSAPVETLLDHPAGSFIRFCQNHGLLQLRDRPIWRTVKGGSRTYVQRLAAMLGDSVRLGCGVTRVERVADGVMVHDTQGRTTRFDQVVIGTHADQALAMLAAPSEAERRLLGAFRYSRNMTVLHSDASLMPRRRRAWSSWNYMGVDDGLCVTYWMNRLQGLPGRDLFVTLNPPRPPRPDSLLHSELYEHPVFDAAAVRAQQDLWSLQGQGGVWFCGAHFGAGFHEDGLQSGLAVAEQLGGLRRPWTVADESGRIHVAPVGSPSLARAA
ncbi:MAG: NAD(P)/FAD-dependent oxidoreductase [Caulobacter sp.]|nr:NAD(P)/FAD-dependent oxidoreductase [Caulobacter sp.]